MLPQAWLPMEGIVEAEHRDHVPFRDWERAGFLHLCSGNIIDYTDVERAVYEAAEEFDLRCVGLDPALSRTLTSRLMAPYNDAGEPKPAVECIDIPQGVLHMSPPTKELERLIYSHRMRHIHNTCARWCFGNARCYVDANEFQSTPPCGGATGHISPFWTIFSFQSTPPYKGRQQKYASSLSYF